MKKIASGIVLSLLTQGYLLASEPTPYKIPASKLIVVADVINFAYNCVPMEDNSVIYELIPNSYAKTGIMRVSIYCLQYKADVILPLTLENNKITTLLKTYGFEFEKSAPTFCHSYKNLNISQTSSFAQGYTITIN